MTATNYLHPVNNRHVDRAFHVLRCNLRHAWKFTQGDPSIGVCSTEYGFDTNMYSPADGGYGNLRAVDYVGGGSSPSPFSGDWHGCNVVSLIFEKINTGVGFPGVAPSSKFLLSTGSAGEAAAAAEAMANGAKIFQVSMGPKFLNPGDPIIGALDYIQSHGGIVCWGAGNGPMQLYIGPQPFSGTYVPATYPGVVCVSGTGDYPFDAYDTPWNAGIQTTPLGLDPALDYPFPSWASNSYHGALTDPKAAAPGWGERVDVVTPSHWLLCGAPSGAAVQTTSNGQNDDVPALFAGNGPNYQFDGYADCSLEVNGEISANYSFHVGGTGARISYAGPTPEYSYAATSYATPLAAGICALIWSANPALSATEVKTILKKSANRGKHSNLSLMFPNAGVADAGKGVKLALSTRADHTGVVLPYLGFSGTGVSISTDVGVGASGVGTMRLAGDVWLDVSGFVNGREVKQAELLLNGVTVYRGSPCELHFPSATAGSNLLTIRSYADDGSFTEETYSDVLVGSLGTAANYTDTTTTYNVVPAFAKPQAFYNQRHNLTHAWKFTTGSKSVKVAMANINDGGAYLPTAALSPAPDYTFDCDAGTTNIARYTGDGNSHGDAVYSIFAGAIAPDCYNLVLQSVEPAARLAKAVELGVNIITDSDGTNSDGPDAAGQASLTDFVNAATDAVAAGILYFMATDDNAGFNPMSPLQVYYDADNHMATGQMSWAATAPGVQQVGHAGGQLPYPYDEPWLGAGAHTTPVVPGSIPASEVWGYGPGIPFTSPGQGVWCNNKYDGQYATLKVTQQGGTSYSCPTTAGCAALVWSANPSLTKDQVLAILNQTKSVGVHADYKTIYPKGGFVDAGRGVKMALATLSENAGKVFPFVGLAGPSVALDYGEAGQATLVAQGTVDVAVGGYCNVSSLAGSSCKNDVTTVELWSNGKRAYRGPPGTFRFSGLATGTYPLTVIAETASGLVARETYTDVLVPELPEVRLVPTVTSFTMPTTGTSRTVAVSTFTASDPVGVTGYLITADATPPAPDALGWSSSPPTSFTFPTFGSVTAYAWAKNADGAVSDPVTAAVVLTQVAPAAPTWKTIVAGEGSLTCRWNASQGAESYTLYYSAAFDRPGNDAGYPSQRTRTSGKIPSSSLETTIVPLNAGLFWVYVAAVNGAGSAWSTRYQVQVSVSARALTMTAGMVSDGACSLFGSRPSGCPVTLDAPGATAGAVSYPDNNTWQATLSGIQIGQTYQVTASDGTDTATVEVEGPIEMPLAGASGIGSAPDLRLDVSEGLPLRDSATGKWTPIRWRVNGNPAFLRRS